MQKFSFEACAVALCSALLSVCFSQSALAQAVVVAAPPPPPVVVAAPAPVVVAAPAVAVVEPPPVFCHWVRRREPDNGYYGWHWHSFRVCN
ncbi:hypothetical protein BGC_41150 [Burkholderia sp. 3C]